LEKASTGTNLIFQPLEKASTGTNLIFRPLEKASARTNLIFQPLEKASSWKKRYSLSNVPEMLDFEKGQKGPF